VSTPHPHQIAWAKAKAEELADGFGIDFTKLRTKAEAGVPAVDFGSLPDLEAKAVKGCLAVAVPTANSGVVVFVVRAEGNLLNRIRADLESFLAGCRVAGQAITPLAVGVNILEPLLGSEEAANRRMAELAARGGM
jgi:hypothetical protein